MRVLGVTINQHLTMSDHVDYLIASGASPSIQRSQSGLKSGVRGSGSKNLNFSKKINKKLIFFRQKFPNDHF